MHACKTASPLGPYKTNYGHFYCKVFHTPESCHVLGVENNTGDEVS